MNSQRAIIHNGPSRQEPNGSIISIVSTPTHKVLFAIFITTFNILHDINFECLEQQRNYFQDLNGTWVVILFIKN